MSAPVSAVIAARFPDAALVPCGARGTSATGDAVVRVDQDEHARRAATGLGAVTNLALLDVLIGLPLGELVEWRDLTEREVSYTRKAPAGVLDRSPEGVRRLLIPPATVPLVVARAASWRKGLERAGAFAPFAQRVMLLPRVPRDLPGKALEADFWGVGVWIQRGDRIEEVVPPEPWEQRYFKAAGWAFRERTYGSWLAMRGQQLATGEPDLFGAAR